MGLKVSININVRRPDPSEQPLPTSASVGVGTQATAAAETEPEAETEVRTPQAPEGFCITRLDLLPEIQRHRVYAVWSSVDSAFHGLHLGTETIAFTGLKKACGWGGLRKWKRICPRSSSEAVRLFLEGAGDWRAPVPIFVWTRV